MSILVKGMKMPTRCWDCHFYEIGHDESYCVLTENDVDRWTPTPRPADCPLIDIKSLYDIGFEHGYAKAREQIKEVLNARFGAMNK